METLNVLVRWLHIVGGVLWLGMLYSMNFVWAPYSVSMDPETRRKVAPGFLPRATSLARGAALFTWATGIFLLFSVYYFGGLMVQEGGNQDFGIGNSLLTIGVVLVLAYLYDLIARSPVGRNDKVFAVVGFVLIALVTYGFINIAGFGYRAYLIHMGALFGTIIIMDGLMRIIPSQNKILAAMKEGTPPDPALFKIVMTRSKHATYLSVPLIWTMINFHTVIPGADSWLYFLGVVIIGWLVVALLYKVAGKLKGS
jgi:uncharacterized membrane protein